MCFIFAFSECWNVSSYLNFFMIFAKLLMFFGVWVLLFSISLLGFWFSFFIKLQKCKKIAIIRFSLFFSCYFYTFTKFALVFRFYLFYWNLALVFKYTFIYRICIYIDIYIVSCVILLYIYIPVFWFFVFEYDYSLMFPLN